MQKKLTHFLHNEAEEDETDLIEEKLTALFLTNPTVDRKHRNPPRKKIISEAIAELL